MNNHFLSWEYRKSIIKKIQEREEKGWELELVTASKNVDIWWCIWKKKDNFGPPAMLSLFKVKVLTDALQKIVDKYERWKDNKDEGEYSKGYSDAIRDVAEIAQKALDKWEG